MHRERRQATNAMTDLLFEKAAVGICLVAPDGTILRANAEWLRCTGLGAEQVVGRRIADLFPEAHDTALAMHGRARAGESVVVRRHGRRAAGREEWWEGSVSAVPMQGGTGLLVTARDVTRGALEQLEAERAAGEARRDAEEVLRRSEDFLSYALATAHTGAWDLDLVDHSAQRSLEHDRIFGYDALLPEWTYERFLEHVVPEDRERVDAAFRRAVETRSDWSFECRILRRGGDVRWIWAAGRHRIDDAGHPRRMAGIVQDITEHKRAEEALRAATEELRESEARFRAIFERASDAVILTDPSGPGRVLAANPAACRLFGYREDEFRGLDRAAIVEPTPALGALLAERDRTGGVAAELTYRRKDGSRFTGELSSATFVDRAGQRRAVAVVRDVTERKRAEEALREANERLRDADRRKDEFLAVLSHELRNPLAPIRNALFLLGCAEPSSDQARRARGVIERQTDQLARLVDDLLDVTRIARGKVELRKARVDLREAVRRTVDDHRGMMEAREIALGVDLPHEPCWVNGDPARLAQIVGNLLQNAAKFTERGGEVGVALVPRADRAELRVRDTGAGIDPALLPRLFEPFTQGAHASRSGGLGLGLALVKALAQLHGGTVEARSGGRGLGAELVVSLPLADESEAAAPVEVPPRRAARTRRVLVVDDDRDAAETLAQVVETFGHVAAVAYDGPSAIEKARASPPDVVLCDLGLPGMSGYEVARALRAAYPSGLRLVAISGYALPEDLQAAADAGFDRHLAKPAQLDEIERLLS